MERIVVRQREYGGRKTYSPVCQEAKLLIKIVNKNNLSQRMIDVMVKHGVDVKIEK